MKKITLGLTLLISAAFSQANAATYIASISETPIDVTAVENGTSQNVLVYVGGPGNASFINYGEGGSYFYVPGNVGLATFTSSFDATPYLFTIARDNDGYFTLQTHVNNKYLPTWPDTSTGNYGSVDGPNGTYTITFTVDQLTEGIS